MSKSFRLMTEHPQLTSYLNRWRRCQAIRLKRDRGSGFYVLEVTDDLAEAARSEARVLFDEMDARAA